MASRPKSTGTYVFFDVVYQDGSRRSNRKVPSELLGGLDGDLPARKLIEAQDEEIAKASGNPRPVIAVLERSKLPKLPRTPQKAKR